MTDCRIQSSLGFPFNPGFRGRNLLAGVVSSCSSKTSFTGSACSFMTMNGLHFMGRGSRRIDSNLEVLRDGGIDIDRQRNAHTMNFEYRLSVPSVTAGGQVV